VAHVTSFGEALQPTLLSALLGVSVAAGPSPRVSLPLLNQQRLSLNVIALVIDIKKKEPTLACQGEWRTNSPAPLRAYCRPLGAWLRTRNGELGCGR